jgi:hypothetical protein
MYVTPSPVRPDREEPITTLQYGLVIETANQCWVHRSGYKYVTTRTKRRGQNACSYTFNKGRYVLLGTNCMQCMVYKLQCLLASYCAWLWKRVDFLLA